MIHGTVSNRLWYSSLCRFNSVCFWPISIASAGEPVKTNEYGEFTLLLEQPEREHVLRVREGTAVTTFTIPDPAAYGED